MNTLRLVTLGLVFAASAHAGYHFQVELKKPSGELVKSEIKIQEGEQGSVELGDTKVELQPSFVDNRQVAVATKIYQMQNGKYVLSAKPSVTTKLNHYASISELNSAGDEAYTVKLIPTETPIAGENDKF